MAIAGGDGVGDCRVATDIADAKKAEERGFEERRTFGFGYLESTMSITNTGPSHNALTELFLMRQHCNKVLGISRQSLQFLMSKYADAL